MPGGTSSYERSSPAASQMGIMRTTPQLAKSRQSCRWEGRWWNSQSKALPGVTDRKNCGSLVSVASSPKTQRQITKANLARRIFVIKMIN